MRSFTLLTPAQARNNAKVMKSGVNGYSSMWGYHPYFSNGARIQRDTVKKQS